MNEQNTNAITAAEARRAYYRAWRAANKDKVKQYNEAYWQRKAEQMAAQEKETEVHGNG